MLKARFLKTGVTRNRDVIERGRDENRVTGTQQPQDRGAAALGEVLFVIVIQITIITILDCFDQMRVLTKLANQEGISLYLKSRNCIIHTQLFSGQLAYVSARSSV